MIYEPRALSALLALEQQDGILLPGATHAGDEVYVATKQNYLLAMSKDKSSLATKPSGELVGISRISYPLFARIMNQAEILLAKHPFGLFQVLGKTDLNTGKVADVDRAEYRA